MSKYSTQNKRRISPSVLEGVLRDVFEHTRVRPEDLLGASRKQPIAGARQLAMWKLRQVRADDGSCRYSAPEIGRVFGRDHSTVLHAERAVEARMVPDTPE